MAFTHSFRNTFPPARFDATPWTRILVEESANGATGWTQIADQAIAVDATPDSPDPVDVTVTSSLERGWFRFRFKDAAAALSPYTAPVASPSTNPLTLEALKARLGLELDADDDELQGYLDAALAQAQAPAPNGCGRLLTPNPPGDSDPDVELTFQMTGHRLRVPDARALAAVEVDGVAAAYRSLSHKGHIVAITVARADPVYETPVLPAERTVTLTGRFGFASIPDDLLEAIYMLAARYHYEKAAQYADQVAVLEGSAVQSYFRQLPPRVKLAFATYTVPSFAGMSLA